MTQDPTQTGGLSADKVAELEHKLADAAAEVARVQAQLQQAKHAGDPPPPVGQPGSTIPPAPSYAGGTSPHVITINGQQLTPGSGNLAAMLQQLTQASATGTPPVVMVNGQNVSGGQVVDVSSYLTPEVTQRIASSLQSLGLDQSLGAMFGHLGQLGAAGQPPAPPEVVGPFADPPRHVPMSYRIATFNLSVYELFIMIIGAVAPIAVWAFFPLAVPGGLIAGVLVIAWFRGRRYVKRIGMLKWGKVATVTNNDTLDKGTYYSGVTYNNMRKRTATGWDAKTIWYSGPAYKNKVDYNLDGATGSLEWRGLEYHRGVILADSRKPTRAMEVSMFPYSVKPGPDGQLTGELSAWLWGGIISTLVIEATVVYLAVYAVLELWVNR
jgi:type II secretory pathway pseudopilin PulG